jgi:hypothetical protein
VPFYGSKTSHSDNSHHFIKTALNFVDDYSSPTESSVPGLLQFLSLFSALVPDGSRLRDENFTFEYHHKNQSQADRANDLAGHRTPPPREMTWKHF